jgi:hypothetical protein
MLYLWAVNSCLCRLTDMQQNPQDLPVLADPQTLGPASAPEQNSPSSTESNDLPLGKLAYLIGLPPAPQWAETYPTHSGRTTLEDFGKQLRNEVDRLRNANFVSPESGSQTQLRGADEGLISGIPTSLHSFISGVADKLLRGFSLTPAERAEVVRLGTSEADLRRFVNMSPQPLSARPTVSAAQTAASQRSNR